MGMKKSQKRDYHRVLSRISALTRCSGLEERAGEIEKDFLEDWNGLDLSSPVQAKQTYYHYRHLVDQAFRDWYAENRIVEF